MLGSIGPSIMLPSRLQPASCALVCPMSIGRDEQGVRRLCEADTEQCRVLNSTEKSTRDTVRVSNYNMRRTGATTSQHT